ncbi:MAG: ATP-dependent RNA helicase DbpA [Pseudomonadales bacterium]|jgi:ATP-independent RNA helicase DbpA|nr:ATP-dependent RNA helicase DbpA [Pseudomonadales bacterium]
MPNFNEIPALTPALLQATLALGYDTMTPIQAAALPLLLAGVDLQAQARTGSGKTAAFGLALLARLQTSSARLQAAVLCPTRELAEQVAQELRALARFIPNLKIISLCGGIPLKLQLASLKHEPQIVTGTPGRLLALLRLGELRVDALATVVLDEADRMLDMGFLDEVAAILEFMPQNRATWLFSATYPREIHQLGARFQRAPQIVKVEEEAAQGAIEQHYYQVEAAAKPAAMVALLRQHQAESCLIFCNTRNDVREVCAHLWANKIAALALHGELEQREREATLVQFANGSARVMVATDVAARGLDIEALPLVLAYELPNDADVHVHRIGRTGRAGMSGVALALVAPAELPRFDRIARMQAPSPALQALPKTQAAPLPPPAMATIAFDAGRQDKLRPGDIVGALTGSGILRFEQIGKIDVFATRAYVAVERAVIGEVVASLRAAKIKGRKVRLHAL